MWEGKDFSLGGGTAIFGGACPANPSPQRKEITCAWPAGPEPDLALKQALVDFFLGGYARNGNAGSGGRDATFLKALALHRPRAGPARYDMGWIRLFH